MSHVVYEEEYLGNYPKPETFSEAEVALSLPTRAAEHQGLYLSTDGDQLVGRAENGMQWVSNLLPSACWNAELCRCCCECISLVVSVSNIMLSM